MPIKNDVVIGKDVKIWHPDLCNFYGCEIGDGTSIGSFCEIQNEVKIGERCKLQAFVFIPRGVIIGDDVFIGPHVCFTNDKYPSCSQGFNCLTTIIEDGVVIGANSTICPGITLGKNCRIGAGAVVTKNIEKNLLVAGNPARIIRRIDNE